jgi:adenosylcobinamide kinase / adenosylcobinamide-phosphate guanylyltransferase
MSIIFVLGGARSGKSRFAESLCQEPRTYIATAQALDDEMIRRIAQHQSDRGKTWQTVEAPLDMVGALRDAKGDVLLDCLTLWLNNLLTAEKDVQAALDGLLTQLQINQQKLVIVSNELGLGLVPEHGLSRRFRDLHGLMNQQVAAIADCVVFTVAGIPQVIKGQLPE